MRTVSVLCWLGFLTLAGAADGGVIHVPADQPTIAAGISAAVRGDVVEIACGTYFEHGLLMKSGITLRGATGDPACVTIDCQSLARGLNVDHCDATTLIEGITIKNGNPVDNGRGGALWMVSSSPTVHACVFQNCTCFGPYAGIVTIQFDNGSPSFLECIFRNNSGGCITVVRDAAINVSRCVFTGVAGITLQNFATAHVSRSSFISAPVGRNTANCKLAVETSLFYQATSAVDSARCCVTNTSLGALWSSGVITANPLLCTPSGPDYYVQTNSPALVTSGPCAGILGAYGAGCGPGAPVSVTVTSTTPGVAIVVDGVPAVTPAVYSWYAMSEHRVSIDSTWAQTSTSRWRFASWSDGGARSHYAVLPPGTTSLVADVRRQWKVRTSVLTDPGAGQGSQIQPLDAWADEGRPFQLTGVPAAGAVFGDWIGIGAGSYTGPANPAVLTLYNSVTQRAHFIPLGFELSISASDTDPSAHQSAPTGGLRSLYLWLTCARSGVSALEAHITGSLPLLAFSAADGVLNAGSGDHLLLAVGNCPSGAGLTKLLGTIAVWDTGGTMCLGPGGGDPFGAVDCALLPAFAPDPGVTGFTSDGSTPCRTGTRTCAGSSDPTLTLPRVPSSAGGEGLKLFAASPNPFARECKLSFVLGRPGHARLEIFDVAGRRVAQVLNADLAAGPQSAVWTGVGRDGARAQDGVYFARLESAGETRLTKLVLLQQGR